MHVLNFSLASTSFLYKPAVFTCMKIEVANIDKKLHQKAVYIKKSEIFTGCAFHRSFSHVCANRIQTSSLVLPVLPASRKKQCD
jgi:hypothetical protein